MIIKGFSLILLDIDHFKKVNDQDGHLIGDEVLKFLASLIAEMAKEEFMCFRYGGEEFALIREYEADGEKVVDQADIALYQSKNKGRNQTTIYKKMEITPILWYYRKSFS